jgi:hypothetical protein
MPAISACLSARHRSKLGRILNMERGAAQMLERLVGSVRPYLTGQNVVALGIAGFVALIVVALAGGGTKPALGPAGAVSAGGGAAGVNVAMAGLTPFVAARPMAFAGRVTQVVTVGADVGWGQVHVWINDGSGTLRELSLAPQSYLTAIGCPALDDARVSGVGFLFDPTRAGAEIYAREIAVGGTTCRLRDDEGLALWMNPTQ